LQKVITDDLDALLEILPPHILKPLRQQPDVSDLIELVFDLGRLPEARFPEREVIIADAEVGQADLDYISGRIGDFGGDNRAGIERTLHRISAFRNRQDKIVGLTCRVGRAVSGTMEIINDLVASGKNILLVGRPGIGKTTMLRETARVLAVDLKRRVIIVDTSNEIAGDGDIPHPAIGRARRMQVPTPAQQHEIMIQAVENHMPEVIVIDEIGTERETQAARTIAERGVQLIGTAHGNTLENLMMNPTLADLIGGIQSVTLGDEEAKRRGTQKSILERTSQPTFDVVVEIQDRDRVSIQPDVGSAVDALLRGQILPTEIRWLDAEGELHVKKEAAPEATQIERKTPRSAAGKTPLIFLRTPLLFLFGANRGRLEQIAEEQGVRLQVTDDITQAEIFLTNKNYFRRKMPKVREAETLRVPIYVLKANTPLQMGQFIQSIVPQAVSVRPEKTNLKSALNEAEEAVGMLTQEEGREVVELSPQSAYIRRLQHLIAERNDLGSRSTGKDPNRRVQIYR
jgi:stage III sporulation protein SpoIIIAA